TRWVASGIVTSAEPKPVMPKTSAPKNAIAASSGASISMDEQRPGARAVHAAKLRHIAREGQPVARLELLRTVAQRAPVDRGRRATEGKGDDVRVVERRHGDHRAAEGALESLQVLVELRVVIHEVHHHGARLAQRQKRSVVK